LSGEKQYANRLFKDFFEETHVLKSSGPRIQTRMFV